MGMGELGVLCRDTAPRDLQIAVLESRSFFCVYLHPSFLPYFYIHSVITSPPPPKTLTDYNVSGTIFLGFLVCCRGFKGKHFLS